MLSRASSAGVSAFTYQSIDFLHKHTHYTVNGRNHFTLWSRTIYACRFFDSCRLPKKYEPSSGVAAGASGACRFCTSKITIKSDVYPRRIILYHMISYHIISYHVMSCHIISYHIILYYITLYYISIYPPYTVQPPRQQEFQLASQLSPIATKKKKKHGSVNNLSLPAT